MAEISFPMCEINLLETTALFRNFVKYLGVFVGPGALEVAWDGVILAYSECIVFLRNLDAGFVPTISLYNVLAASICSWIGSFIAPSHKLLVLEGKSLQRLTHGPWNIFPKALMFQLKFLGFPLQFQSLQRNSAAARVRNGCTTSAQFWMLYHGLNLELSSDDRILRIPDSKWLHNSCIFQIHDSIISANNAGIETPEGILQSEVNSSLGRMLYPF